MLTSLELRNFKAIRAHTFRICPLTLLCGTNSAGKSTLLQSLLAMRQSYLQQSLPGKHLALDGELAQLGTVKDVFCEYAPNDDLYLRLTWQEGHSLAHGFKYEREAGLFHLIDDDGDSESWGESLFQKNFRYLNAERVGPRTSLPTSEYFVREQNQIGPKGELSWHYLSAFGSNPVPIPALLHPSQKDQSLKAQVEAWMGPICPDLQLAVKDHSSDGGMDVVSVAFSFRHTTGSTNQYRPTNVGFGLSYSLPVFVAGLSLEPNGLLLIENPEAHLHPAAQAHVSRFLAQLAGAGAQVIIETHSDHVVNAVRRAIKEGVLKSDDVVVQFFTRVVGEISPTIVEVTLNESGEPSAWPSGFFDQMDEDLKALLR